MNFKLDENIPAALTQLLRELGHQADTVHEEKLAGASDPVVLKAAINEKRILITFDLDFANVRSYPLGSHSGIIVFRLIDQRWKTLYPIVKEIIEQIHSEALEGALAIVEPGRVRFRKLN